MREEEGSAARGKVLIKDSEFEAPMVSNCMSPWTKPAAAGFLSPHVTEFPRKRKGSDSDPSQEAHSQTEKRRRDKMNNLIEELSAVIPRCKPMPRKLDKLTVLRMAVQHLKSLKGDFENGPHSWPSEVFPVFETAEAFLFVIGCERGKIIFVSKSVSKILHYDQASLTGQSLFDLLHPKDVAKVKEQLSSDISSREKLIDTKNHRKFCTIHCTGYLRNWPPNIVGMEEGRDNKENHSFTCLVAIGRLYPYIVPQDSGEIKVKPTEFITRFAMNGKFVYVDQRGRSETGRASLLPCRSQSFEGSSGQSCVGVPGTSAGTVLGAGRIGTDIANEALNLQRLLGDSRPTDLMKDSLTINCRNRSDKEFPRSPSEVGELEATRQDHSPVAPHGHEPRLGGGAQRDLDALCDSDDTAIAAFMN